MRRLSGESAPAIEFMLKQRKGHVTDLLKHRVKADLYVCVHAT